MLGKTGFVLLLLHGLMVMLYDFVTEMSTFFRVVLQAVEASVGGLASDLFICFPMSYSRSGSDVCVMSVLSAESAA